MGKFMNWLENSFAPKMNNVARNAWFAGINDSIMQTMPLIFLGSIFCMLTIPSTFFTWWPNFWEGYYWSFGLISLFISFLVPFNLLEQKGHRQARINGGIAGAILFLFSVNPQFIADQTTALGKGTIGFTDISEIGGFGAGGMFLAIITGLVAAAIINKFATFSFFSEDSAIPDFVRSWFDSMLPMGIIVLGGWILTSSAFLNFNLYQAVVDLFMPLQDFAQNMFGFTLILFLNCFIYSLGISGWVMSPLTTPIETTAAAVNATLVQNGTATAATIQIYSHATIYSAYLWIGGIGCTLPLVIMMLGMAKSHQLKALGRACIAPAIFNINEPCVFGCIAWNPLLMLPMWINGFILPLFVYIFTKVIPFAPIPTLLFQLWYTPFPISTWLTTGAVTGIILAVAVFVISWCVWMPFFRVYDKQLCEKEATVASEGEKDE